MILTTLGRETFQQMAERHEALIDSLFLAMSDEDMDALLRLTTKLDGSLRGSAIPTEDR